MSISKVLNSLEKSWERDDILLKIKNGLGTDKIVNEFLLKNEIQIRPRSGLAAKNNISVLNTPGTIDSDYRGEIKVIIYNHGNENFSINNGDRIAQMILAPVVKMELEEKNDLPKSIRGKGGFGSTGK